MRRSLFRLLVVGALFTTIASADDAVVEAIAKDRNRIVGDWQVVELVVSGNKALEEDAKKLKVVNGSDGTWTLLFDGKEISKGTSTLDPMKTPKIIDFTPIEGGGKGNKYRGIYTLGDNRRKLCFAPPEQERPTKFSSTSGSELILVTFERRPRQTD